MPRRFTTEASASTLTRARAIKQKRLANRDKNPATIFFCSLPVIGKGDGREEKEEARGWLNSVRASTDKRQTPSLSSSFVCFKRHLFGGLARGFSKLGEATRGEVVAVVEDGGR